MTKERINIIQGELKRMAKLSRTHSKGLVPQLVLTRIAQSLESLQKSLDEEVLSQTNPFTKREKEILEYVSQGFTNRDIASALLLSEKTIEFHLKSILNKTEAANRTEAVRSALKNKWIE